MERIRLAYRKFNSERLGNTQLAMWCLITVVVSFYAIIRISNFEWDRWTLFPAVLISFFGGLIFVIASGKAATHINRKRAARREAKNGQV